MGRVLFPILDPTSALAVVAALAAEYAACLYSCYLALSPPPAVMDRKGEHFVVAGAPILADLTLRLRSAEFEPAKQDPNASPPGQGASAVSTSSTQ